MVDVVFVESTHFGWKGFLRGVNDADPIRSDDMSNLDHATISTNELLIHPKYLAHRTVIKLDGFLCRGDALMVYESLGATERLR